MCKPLCQSLWQRANGLNLSLETLYNGQFTLSAQMIKPITGILYSPTNAVPGFILNFTPFIHSLHQFEINSANHRLQTSWKKIAWKNLYYVQFIFIHMQGGSMLYTSIDLLRTCLWVTVWFFSWNFQTQERDLPSFPLNFKLKYLAWCWTWHLLYMLAIYCIYSNMSYFLFKGKRSWRNMM